MNCDNPACSNVVVPGHQITINTRFLWEDPPRVLHVCSQECVNPAVEVPREP